MSQLTVLLLLHDSSNTPLARQLAPVFSFACAYEKNVACSALPTFLRLPICLLRALNSVLCRSTLYWAASATF